MQYPFEITKKGANIPLEIPAEIQAKLLDSFDPEASRFVWDGKRFFWNDLEAGHLDIDFFSKKMRYRMQHINKAQEPLLRALGWKSTEQKHVFDMTAGLGRDACLLFFAGFNVTMFERNPVLQILLKNALSEIPANEFTQCFKLAPQDSISYLTNIVEKNLASNVQNDQADKTPFADAIYIDPMYPERKKSALVKKELRIIRNLVGADFDSEQLLETAIKSGVARVVVKRPKGSEYVADLAPSHSVESPNTRFDVYLKSGNSGI